MVKKICLSESGVAPNSFLLSELFHQIVCYWTELFRQKVGYLAELLHQMVCYLAELFRQIVCNLAKLFTASKSDKCAALKIHFSNPTNER